MYVCLCNRVTDRQILDAAERGVTTLEALGEQLKVATCCGRCAEYAHDLLVSQPSKAPSHTSLRAA